MISERCSKHNCPLIEICNEEYGTRLICIECCNEDLIADRAQRENDFYGTELETEDYDEELG